MLGLIFKVFLFFAVIIGGALVILNATNVWNPGTVSLSRPDVAPCHRYLEIYHKDRSVELVQVRWIMTAKNYGWGCYFEFGDFEVETVSPMPEV